MPNSIALPTHAVLSEFLAKRRGWRGGPADCMKFAPAQAIDQPSSCIEGQNILLRNGHISADDGSRDASLVPLLSKHESTQLIDEKKRAHLMVSRA